MDHFLEEIFIKSDTSMAIVSSLPIRPEHSAESIQVRDKARRIAHAVCHDDRLLMQGEAHPTLAPTAEWLAAMEQSAAAYPLAAWKVYTHQPGPAVVARRPRGRARAGRGAVHPQGRRARDPAHLRAQGTGRAGATGRRSTSVPRRGAIPTSRSSSTTRATTSAGSKVRTRRRRPTHGVNRLITSMMQAGIGPNQNVYAELGTTWYRLMQTPDQAAHVLGKLLKYVGEDNVLWGTDSIWYGSPQDQIQALRTFEISPELQETLRVPGAHGRA